MSNRRSNLSCDGVSTVQSEVFDQREGHFEALLRATVAIGWRLWHVLKSHQIFQAAKSGALLPEDRFEYQATRL